jgi:hypothetical protein
LSTWLIGSALSKEKLRVKSCEFLKYFLLSFLCFVLFALFSLFSYRPPDKLVEVNGIKIPIGNFLDGSTDFGKTNDIDSYCDCLIEEYQKYPVSTITNDKFIESKLGVEIASMCIAKSKK